MNKRTPRGIQKSLGREKRKQSEHGQGWEAGENSADAETARDREQSTGESKGWEEHSKRVTSKRE